MVVSKDPKNKRSDDDILRARDIIPTEPTRPEEPNPLPTKKTDKAAKPAQQQNSVPKFNLAKEIMAEQRRITAIKRKAPDKKTEPDQPQVQSVKYAIEQPGQVLAKQDQIITEIVARDIKRLCRGGYSANNE